MTPATSQIIGVSPAMRKAVGLALRFAVTELPILLVGPTGSGKELFARQIHTWSGNRGAFVDVNAGALPRDMVESLLFGHRRGAFTGATSESLGLIPAAQDGTLFLDELASLPGDGQAKLLRAIENGEVRRLGDTVSRQVRCRFVAAVQEDIDLRVQRGEFRLDLYQRLAGVVIRLPSLADRAEDVIPIGRTFAFGLGCELSNEAEAILKKYEWPGNVRELKIAIQRARFLADSTTIDAGVMREAIELGQTGRNAVRTGQEAPEEVRTLMEVCREHGWHIGRTAQALGLGQATLYRRLRRAGVDLSTWRGPAEVSIAGRSA